MNVIRYYSCALVVVYFQLSISLAPHELTFLIISQNYSFSSNLANELKNNILHQIQIEAFLNNNEAGSVQQPKIILSHETFNSIGSWAITPILASSTEYIDNIIFSRTSASTHRKISKSTTTSNIDNSASSARAINAPTATEIKWLILCEDQSIVDLKALINNLKNEDYTKDIFLGYPLRDSEATIIHHFAFFENPSWFLYPLFRAGVAISIPLLKKLSERVQNEKIFSDFFIDASHELSLFAWNNGKGHKLTKASYFCLERKSTTATATTTGEGNGCAIYSRNRDDGVSRHNRLYSIATTAAPPPTESSFNVSSSNVFFAVKTWSKNHLDRIPIIQKTWAQHTKFIRYYSDAEDSLIPTTDTNVENTETGHCAKALVIFHKMFKEISTNKYLSKHIKWIVLTDDDTLLSVPTLLAYLRRFNANADIYLGERYGYQLLSPNGFNYITGGGGIVFSVSVIEKLVESCTCPTASSPDDMIIALCLQRIGIEPIHSSRFHQARPIDYPEELLLHNDPISFHKFWQIDPFYVYETWLGGNVAPMKIEKKKYKIQQESGSHCSINQSEKQHSCHANIFQQSNRNEN